MCKDESQNDRDWIASLKKLDKPDPAEVDAIGKKLEANAAKSGTLNKQQHDIVDSLQKFCSE